MRILVVGATGTIGSAAVAAALAAGHEVSVLVRSPDKLGEERRRVQVIEGDVLGDAIVAAAVAGQDAVINALGSSPDPGQLDVPASAMRTVVDAMQRHGVRRLVGLAGGAVSVPGERKPFASRVTSAVVRFLARNVVEAKQREFAVVHAAGLDWTMVRPPRVDAGPPSGRVVLDDRLHAFRVSSGDVGEAMARLAANREWVRRAPYVSARSAGPAPNSSQGS